MKIEYLLSNTSSNDYSNSNRSYLRQKQPKPNLTDSERETIYSLLNKSIFNGKLPRGVLQEISERFGVKPRTISRIWRQGQDSIRRGLMYPNVCSKIKLNSGRKKSCNGLKYHQSEEYYIAESAKYRRYLH